MRAFTARVGAEHAKWQGIANTRVQPAFYSRAAVWLSMRRCCERQKPCWNQSPENADPTVVHNAQL